MEKDISRIKIIRQVLHERGVLYTFSVQGSSIDILFLYHAIDRAQKWQLSVEKIAESLLFPDEVIKGHFDRFIAHKIYGNHVLRAVYEYDNLLPVLITVYLPDAKRYFQGGGEYENKIFN